MAWSASDPDTGVYNSSFHRCYVRDPNHLVMFFERRHMWDYYVRAEQRGKPLPVACVIGHTSCPLSALGFNGFVWRGFGVRTRRHNSPPPFGTCARTRPCPFGDHHPDRGNTTTAPFRLAKG